MGGWKFTCKEARNKQTQSQYVVNFVQYYSAWLCIKASLDTLVSNNANDGPAGQWDLIGFFRPTGFSGPIESHWANEIENTIRIGPIKSNSETQCFFVFFLLVLLETGITKFIEL